MLELDRHPALDPLDRGLFPAALKLRRFAEAGPPAVLKGKI
jgi:hypothetical protein